jgi:hypothetical protein
MTDAGILGVETVEEHEDGSATYKFHMDAHCRGLLAEEGLKLVLYCAAANMDMQLVYDFIEDHIKYEKDELTEYKFGNTDESQKCVSCGGPAKSDFCEFCLNEE